MADKLRVTITTVYEYTPVLQDYGDAATIEDARNIDFKYYSEYPEDIYVTYQPEVTVTVEVLPDPDRTDPVPEDAPL